MGKEVRITALLVIDTVFFLLEAIVGYAVHSLALVADSFHMLNDIFSLVVALWAVRVATTKGADARYTYGWKRAEILGALINAVFLLALCFSIFIEAIQRLVAPSVVSNPQLILFVGSAGLVSNFVGLFLFHEHGHGHGHSHGSSSSAEDEEESVGALLPEQVVKRYTETTGLLENQSHGHSHVSEHSHSQDTTPNGGSSSPQKKKKKSMNMEGVFLHVLGDALGNVGVMITAIFIWKTDYSWKYYSDPIVSLVITGIIFSSALPLCRRSSRILLQATPTDISADSVQSEIIALDGVKSVHDFHIWNLTEDIFIASLHVEVDGNPEAFLVVASSIRAILHNYGIHSATVQPEFTGPNNISSETYQHLTKAASGKFSRQSSTDALRQNGPTNGLTTYGTSKDCIIDNALNCNAQKCLDPVAH